MIYLLRHQSRHCTAIGIQTDFQAHLLEHLWTDCITVPTEAPSATFMLSLYHWMVTGGSVFSDSHRNVISSPTSFGTAVQSGKCSAGGYFTVNSITPELISCIPEELNRTQVYRPLSFLIVCLISRYWWNRPCPCQPPSIEKCPSELSIM